MKQKTRNGGQWTEARFKAFVISLLRAGSLRWGPRNQAIKAAFVANGINPKTGRKCKLHRCPVCRRQFTQSEMRVDHIKPVVDPARGFCGWDEYIQRMFCEAENFMAICRSCHDVKTKEERKK